MVSSSATVPGPQANRGSAIIEAKAEIYLSPSAEPIRGLARLIVMTARSLKSLRFSGALFHPAQGGETILRLMKPLSRDSEDIAKQEPANQSANQTGRQAKNGQTQNRGPS
jgi:hypothetical protein